jgi:tRNA (guanine-N7-)-methyltransferase
MARLRKSQKRWVRSSTEADAASVLIKCALPVFTLDPVAIFNRDAPLEVEIGAGRGDFILSRATAHPDRNLLAIELSTAVTRLLALRVARSDSPNVRVLQADARSIVNLLLPDRAVSVFHIYFPDPWPKDRHAKHRLFSPFFVANLARTIRPDGILYVATDVRDYARRILALLDSQGFIPRSQSAPGDSNSNFAKKFAAEGRPLFSAGFALAPNMLAESSSERSPLVGQSH